VPRRARSETGRLSRAGSRCRLLCAAPPLTRGGRCGRRPALPLPSLLRPHPTDPTLSSPDGPVHREDWLEVRHAALLYVHMISSRLLSCPSPGQRASNWYPTQPRSGLHHHGQLQRGDDKVKRSQRAEMLLASVHRVRRWRGLFLWGKEMTRLRQGKNVSLISVGPQPICACGTKATQQPIYACGTKARQQDITRPTRTNNQSKFNSKD
jgi:hypothetical protein